MADARRQTQTGGRDATGGHIPGDVALAVGCPNEPTPTGFRWCRLTDLGRLETGHTPSRRVLEYWDGGTLPWIGVRDATSNHGRTIFSTNEYITELGELNSSTRLLPTNTVCLSRTASVGYVVVTGVPMCTSQDFVNWICGPDLDYRYLKYILLAEKKAFLRFATGTTHQTVYFPEVKAFHVMVPGISEQRAIADVLGALDDKIESNNRVTETALKLISTKFEMEETLSVERIPLSSLISLERGREPGREMCREDGVGTPFIRVSNLKMETHRGLTLTHFEGPLAKADDVLISFDGTPGRVAFGLTGFFSSGVRRAIPAGRPLPTSLIWAMLSGVSVQGVISEYSTGTTIQHAGSALPHLTAPLLSGSGFSWFENEGENLWRYILSLRRSSETLFSLRTSLSLEMLSGRLRVKDAESMMENV